MSGRMDMNHKKVHTFAICAYKESSFLEECILSLKKQTVRSKIIIVTSTPNDLIREMAEKYEIPLYVNQNGGITQDWNFAYQMAESDYVTIAHQDDIYSSRYAENVIARMKKSKDPIICFTDYYEVRNGRKVCSNRNLRIKRMLLLPLRLSLLQRRIGIRRLVLAFGCPICCPSVTFSKRKITKEPFQAGFRSDEDWEAWERLSRLKGEYIYIPRMLMGHRIHKESETTNILKDHARSQEDYIMFRKFWPDLIARKLTQLYASSEKSNDLDV